MPAEVDMFSEMNQPSEATWGENTWGSDAKDESEAPKVDMNAGQEKNPEYISKSPVQW